MSDHIKAVRKVMEVISLSGLTLNRDKCHFECKEIKFWGMITAQKERNQIQQK